MRFIEWLYLSQFWMALSAAAYVFANARLLGRRLPWDLYGLAIWGTWLVYSLDARAGNSAEDRVNQPRRTQFVESHDRITRVLIILAVLRAAWLLAEIRAGLLAGLLLLLLGVVGIGYAVAMLPWRTRRLTLKQTGVAKSFIITAAWAGGGIGVALCFGRPTSEGPAASPWLIAILGSLVLFLDTLMLDYRDREGDTRNGIRTAATILGARTRPFLLFGTALLALLWASHLPHADARWWAAGLGASAWLIPVLAYDKLEKNEVWFGIAVSGWRMTMALALWLAA